MKLAIVGAGEVVVRGHVPELQRRTDIEVVAVCDPTASQRDAAADALGVPVSHRFADHGDMWGAVSADAVLVATPPTMRTDIIAAASANGVHVVCEKPIALTLSEADVVLAAGAPGSITMCHNYLFFEEYAAAARLIAEGAIGSVETVLLQGLGANPWPGASGFRPGWRDDLPLGGGGRFMDTGVHAVYLMELLFRDRAKSVSAEFVRGPGGGDSRCHAMYCFDAGVAIVNIGRGQGPAAVSVTGSEGRLVFDFPAEAGDLAVAPERLVVLRDDRVTHEVPMPRRGMFTSAFYDQVVTDVHEGIAAGDSDGAAGRRALELVLGAYQAAVAGSRVPLPLRASDPVYAGGLAGLTNIVV
jgi:predicted dehydrogenase